MDESMPFDEWHLLIRQTNSWRNTMDFQKKRSTHKMLALFFFVLLYLILTYRLIFVSVPQMLREADTTVNTMAIVAAAAWVACSIYAAVLIVNRKTTKKGNIE